MSNKVSKNFYVNMFLRAVSNLNSLLSVDTKNIERNFNHYSPSIFKDAVEGGLSDDTRKHVLEALREYEKAIQHLNKAKANLELALPLIEKDIPSLRYLQEWCMSYEGMRLEKELSPEHKILMCELESRGLVAKRFNGGNTCYVIND